MQIESTQCVFTGCDIIVSDSECLSLIHGDLYLVSNHVTGSQTLYMGGISRAKNGKMHVTSFDFDAPDIPPADITVYGGIVVWPASPTGYAQLTFAQNTCVFNEQVTNMLNRYFGEVSNLVIRKYQTLTPD